MAGFLLRLAISAFGLWLASLIVPGVTIRGTGTLVAAAFLLGVVNALVRPLVVVLTLPITIVTLGVCIAGVLMYRADQQRLRDAQMAAVET